MKHTANLIIAFLLLLGISCGTKKKQAPDTVLSKDKMIGVMVDVHVVEAAISLNYIRDSSNVDVEKKYKNVFKKHNLTREQYEESIQYYTSNPEIMIEVYDGVLDSLSRLQAQAINHTPKDQKTNPALDSLNNGSKPAQ